MTTPNRNLLVELFCEELPPKALKRLGESFAEGVAAGLRQRGLASDASVVTPFATPRRLAVHVTDVAAVAPDSEVAEKLMAANVALDADGKPTEALRKRLAKVGRANLAQRWPDADDGPDKLYLAGDGAAELKSYGGMSSRRLGSCSGRWSSSSSMARRRSSVSLSSTSTT